MNKQEQQIQTAIRLSPPLLKRLDEHAEFMSKAGVPITRAEVLRLAATEGIAVLEARRKKR
jgi:predicted DNA-binding protein